jgi:hypothetical protein
LRIGEKAEHAKLVSFVIKKIINVLCATTGKKPAMLKKHTRVYIIIYTIHMTTKGRGLGGIYYI